MKRNTWQREAVRDALDRTEGFISAQALHGALHRDGSSIGLATVYRALGDLATSGDADSLQSPDGEAIYRACTTTGHHHHLICRNCGLTVEIEADEVEAWARRAAAEHGFTGAAHVVDVFGLCASCTKLAEAEHRRLVAPKHRSTPAGVTSPSASPGSGDADPDAGAYRSPRRR